MLTSTAHQQKAGRFGTHKDISAIQISYTCAPTFVFSTFVHYFYVIYFFSLNVKGLQRHVLTFYDRNHLVRVCLHVLGCTHINANISFNLLL